MGGMLSRMTPAEMYLAAMGEEPVFYRPAHNPKGMLGEEVAVFEMVSKYFPPNAVPAIMGNLAVESHDPWNKTRFGYDVKEKGGKGGYGVPQYTGGKKTDYFKWLNKHSKTDSLESQIQYMKNIIYSDSPAHEIGKRNQERLQTMFSDSSIPIDEMTKNFMDIFERPEKGKERLSERIGWAKKYDPLLPFDEF